jgi:hypothetical protein
MLYLKIVSRQGLKPSGYLGFWVFKFKKPAQSTMVTSHTNSPILSYPTEDDLFILDTDASNEGMGSVLSQVQNGIERVICYFSKAFSKQERRYCVTRRELLLKTPWNTLQLFVTFSFPSSMFILSKENFSSLTLFPLKLFSVSQIPYLFSARSRSFQWGKFFKSDWSGWYQWYWQPRCLCCD